MRLRNSSIMYLWLIDRIACGYEFELLRSQYERIFSLALDRKYYDEFVKQNSDKIHDRYQELKVEIERGNIFNKLNIVADKIFNLIDTDSNLTAKELSSLAATFKGYYESFRNFSINKSKFDQPRIATQNNFLIFQTLADEGVITIMDVNRLKELSEPKRVD